MNNVVDSSVKTVISTGKMEDFFTMLHEYDSIRIAIYDEFQDKIYPFLQVSIASTGKYLDCSAIFKLRDDYMLGAAMVLAEKISKKNVKLLIKDTESRVKPILSIAGKYTKFFLPTEFFTKICSIMANKAYFLNNWQIFDDRIIADFKKPDEPFLCSITMGVIPGIATRAQMYVQMEGTKILLDSNTVVYSTKGYDYKQLFDGLFDNTVIFHRLWESAHLMCSCHPEEYIPYIKKAIGKKRINALIFPVSMKRRDFFKELLKQTGNFCLSEYYDNMLKNSYYQILRILAKEEGHELA